MEKSKTNSQELNTSYQRPWGHYIVTAKGNGYLTKIIHVNANQRLSVQSHNHRSEHWTVVKGKATVILNENKYDLIEGQSIDIKVKDIHSLQNNTCEPLEIIEIQMGEILSEEDIIRYQDIYGRI